MSDNPKLSLMQRTATRLMLHDEHGVPVDTAFEPLAQGFGELVRLPECPTCGGTPCVNPSFCARSRADDRKVSRRRDTVDPAIARARRLLADDVSLDRAWAEINDPRTRPAPQATIEAIKYELRTYGLPQLAKPNCQRRLNSLWPGQAEEIIAALKRLRPKYPKIDDELITAFATITGAK